MQPSVTFSLRFFAAISTSCSLLAISKATPRYNSSALRELEEYSQPWQTKLVHKAAAAGEYTSVKSRKVIENSIKDNKHIALVLVFLQAEGLVPKINQQLLS